MDSFAFSMCVLVVIICVTIANGGPENPDEHVKELVERMVNELVYQKVTEIRNEFQTVTDVLKQENVKQRAEIEELRKQMENVTKVNRPATNENSLNRQNSVIGNLTENATREDLHDVMLPSTSLRGRRAGTANVAFCAYLSITQRHLTGEAIRFDQVLLNDGSAYNSYTGAFTAPLSGVYLFTFNFDNTRQATYVRLVINGVNQVDAVAIQHDASDHRYVENMGGNSAILHVDHGQAVLVEVYQVSDVEVASSNTYRLSTFSGVLLY